MSKNSALLSKCVSYAFDFVVHDFRDTEGNKLGAVVRLCRSASFLAPGWKSGVLFPSRTQRAGLNLSLSILTLSALMIIYRYEARS